MTYMSYIKKHFAFFSSFFFGGKGLKNFWDRIITKLYHHLTSMASYDIVGLYLTTFWIWLKFVASLSIDSIPKKEVWWYHHTDLHKPTMAHKCHTRYFYHRSSYFHNMCHCIINQLMLLSERLILLYTRTETLSGPNPLIVGSKENSL